MKKIEIRSLIIIFLISSLLYFLFPYTGDDIAWGFNSFSFDMIKLFSNDISLNGRYMGNILSVLLAKNIIIKALCISLVTTSILYIIHKYMNVKYRYILLFMLIMPLDIFKESLVWMSGFTNYVASTLSLLIFLILFQKIWKNNKFSYTSIALFIMTVITSLFIENLTIFLLLWMIASNIIYYVKNKKLNINLIIGLIGSCIGFYIMFSHPTYINIFKGNDGYRNINDQDGIINRIFGNFGLVMKKYIIEGSAILFGTILYVVNKYYKKKKRTNKWINFAFDYSYIYLFYAFLMHITNLESKLPYLVYINILLAGLFIILFLFIIYKLFKQNNNVINIVLILAGVLAPLFIATPIGPRNMFLIYVLEVLLLFVICHETKYVIKEKYVLSFVLILLTYYFVIYGNIYYFYNKRINYVENLKITKNEIVLYRLPLGEYLYEPDYSTNQRSYFRMKYHIDPDTLIRYVDYEEFVKQ